LKTSNLHIPLEHCDHAIPVLPQELTSLKERLVVLRTSRKDCRIDYAENGKHQVEVLLEGIGIVELYRNI
jgi:hypothetical protein